MATAAEATQRTKRAGFMSKGEAPTAIWATDKGRKNLLCDVWVTVLLPRFLGVWHGVAAMYARSHAAVAASREVRNVRRASWVRHGVAALLASAALSSAEGANAFCRTVSEKPPPGYDPQTGCFTGSADAKLLYWKNACVGYSLNRAASSKVTLDDASKIVADAFAVWSAAPCDMTGGPSVNAVDEGPVDCGLVEYNKNGPNQNVIVFRDDAWPYSDVNNTLGLTTVTYDTRTGEIYDADMEINSTVAGLVATDPVPPGSYDLRNIITHEAGHFLGLAHSPEASAVMFARYHEGSTMLTDDDVSGICTIYATDGARATTAGAVAAGPCDATARHGFSTECGSTHPNPPPADDAQASGGGGCSMTGARGPRGLAAAIFVGLAVAAARLRRSRRLNELVT